MKDFVSSVRDTIEKFNMIDDGDCVIVAVSGGADSTALLYVFNELKSTYNLKLLCAHINHNIRGKEAYRDENFVKSMCDTLNVEYICKSIDVPTLSKQTKKSEELVGREQRYIFFNELCEKYGYNKIAVAHNMNDSVETVLINLTRGSSLNGLRGIQPVNKNIIRPLIETQRADIEIFLSDNNIEFVNDSTNSQNIYTRNIIRNEVINKLSDINPSFISTVYNNSFSISDDDDYILQCAKQYFNKCVQKVNDEVVIDLVTFSDLHISLKKRIILYAVSILKGSKMNIENKHLDILSNLCSTGKKYDISSDLKAYIEYDKLILCNKYPKFDDYNYNIEYNKLYSINNMRIKFCVTTNTDISDKNCMYVSGDNVQDIIIRNYRYGDKFIPSGMNQEKKISRFFIDNKIPRNVRSIIPLLCINGEIAAVIGYRVSEKYKVNDNTECIIKIIFEDS